MRLAKACSPVFTVRSLPSAFRGPIRRPLVLHAWRWDGGKEQEASRERQLAKQRPRLQRLIAGTAAVTAASAAAALATLLPAGVASAMDSLAPYDAPLSLDTELVEGASPELVEVLTFVVATYVGLMLLYLWLASMIDEEPGAAANGNDAQNPAQSSIDDPQQQQLPPGYSRYLHAHIRSVREPRRGQHALVAPSPEDDPAAYAGALSGLKQALSGQAAEYVAQQIKESGAVARRKIYLRRLAAREAGKLPSGGISSSSGSTSSATITVALPLGQPGQLEKLVDECLDNMPKDVLENGSENGLVRSIMGVVARRLAAAEAEELILSMHHALQHSKKDSPAILGW